MVRSTTEVIEDHLVKRLEGDTEADIKTNFSQDVLLLSNKGTFEGHNGIRQSARTLSDFVGKQARFIYTHTLIKGGYAYLEWEAARGKDIICRGADSFVVEEGKIVFQSVYYYRTTTEEGE